MLASLFSPRIGLKSLALLCRRLAISTDAGLDIRRIWDREARGRSWIDRKYFEQISAGVSAGDSLHDSLSRTGPYFPRLFREMVEVGEKTGSLAEVFRQLADHYELRLQTRRAFLSSITGPMLQLSAALTVVGLLIWIMGMLGQSNGQPIDLLGFGLIGTPGLIAYLGLLALAVAAVGGVLFAISRGLAWTRPLQHLFLRMPFVGGALRTIALARMAWTLHLTMNVDMGLRTVLPLALRSTGNDYYARLGDEVVANVLAGDEIHEALRRTRAFPEEFLETLEVGEMSGQIVESMGRLSRQYEERAQAAIATLTTIAGFGVWAMVALVIILLIFRLASFYIGAINAAAGI